MDVVRWIVLVLLFAGLFGLWFWSKRQARLNSPKAKNPHAGFKVTQKRWLDQRTGICLVEAEGQEFLLAYTVGGGVSWQPVLKKEAKQVPEALQVAQATAPALDFGAILAETGRR